jgi:hypothetical protein
LWIKIQHGKSVWLHGWGTIYCWDRHLIPKIDPEEEKEEYRFSHESTRIRTNKTAE